MKKLDLVIRVRGSNELVEIASIVMLLADKINELIEENEILEKEVKKLKER